jgi:monoterpene epsilon-lactone hydrolase
VIVYAHGGSYTSESAWSSIPCSALVAARTGIRVLSIDYTLAPHQQWDETTSQVARVIAAVIDDDRATDRVATMGHSAGGALVAESVLQLRDELGRMPSALVLWSPWADITESGDTYATLRSAELEYTYERHLSHSARAYAPAADQRHPYVSPVYGDFRPGFPPTLIQGGTREPLLSCFVRLYQGITAAG